MNSYCFYRPATKHETNHISLSQKETRLSSSFVKDMIKQEKEYEAIANADLNDHNLSDILLTMTNTELQAQANDKAPPYTALRILPGYTVGDPLRSEDFKFLCCSKDAMAFAIHDLCPGDCAFILRSDGSYTYSIFNSHTNGNASLSFRVNEQGHSKVVSVSSLATTARVRVPMLHDEGQSPRRQGPVRQQHSRSLTSNRHSTGPRPRENRAPKSQARKNRTPETSTSLPPSIGATMEMESVSKEDASKFSSKRYGTSAWKNRAPKSQARKTRPQGISSSLPPSIKATKDDTLTSSPNHHSIGVGENRAPTSQARKNRPPGASSSLPPSVKVATELDCANNDPAQQGEGTEFCIICSDAPSTHFFVPCDHMCACRSCAHELMTAKDTKSRKCPICAQPLLMAMEVFLP